MKTLTVKSAQNMPAHAVYLIDVDGKDIGSVKAGATAYFDLQTNAARMKARLPGLSSNTLDITADEHHHITISTKRNILSEGLSVIIYILLSFSVTFFLNLEFFYSMLVNVGLAVVIYIIFKKSRFSGLQISVMKKS